MITPAKQTQAVQQSVTVVGGGLAGIAISIQLARRSFAVTCVEPSKNFERIVGESLDWSAPELLADLGLSAEELIRDEVCTYKRHVVLQLDNGSKTDYVPAQWLGRAPIHAELQTLHVDRLRLHRRLLEIADRCGVMAVQDRVTSLDRQGDRISAVRTVGGLTLVSDWFVDASGAAASLFGRGLELPEIEYGPKKVALWTYVDVKTSALEQGTTLYAEAEKRQYMNWVWEIPINPNTLSVGLVMRADDLKERRSARKTAPEVYRRRLMKVKRLKEVFEAAGSEFPPVHVTSFRCRTYRQVCGPNWLITGEAASLPDPITGNGVTTALRHAAEGADLIEKYRQKGRIPSSARLVYNLRVRHMGRFFNSLIEKLAYEWPIRDRIGLLAAGDIYTAQAWSINHLYSRLRPRGAIGTACFCGVLSLLRGAAWFAFRMCKLFAAPVESGRSQAGCI